MLAAVALGPLAVAELTMAAGSRESLWHKENCPGLEPPAVKVCGRFQIRCNPMRVRALAAVRGNAH